MRMKVKFMQSAAPKQLRFHSARVMHSGPYGEGELSPSLPHSPSPPPPSSSVASEHGIKYFSFTYLAHSGVLYSLYEQKIFKFLCT